ncbi:MAG: hypothetical protein WBV22_06310 [Anaerolineaceae bacterium]
MKEIVHSHSGFRYAEKPISFQWEADEYKIKRIIAEWKTECGQNFTVITDKDRIFELNYDETIDQWQVKPFNQ